MAEKEKTIELVVEIYKNGMPTGEYKSVEINQKKFNKIQEGMEKQPDDDGLFASKS